VAHFSAKIYVGGDIVGGDLTVIETMGMAEKAAHLILESLFRLK
jgi:hypothetical protein